MPFGGQGARGGAGKGWPLTEAIISCKASARAAGAVSWTVSRRSACAASTCPTARSKRGVINPFGFRGRSGGPEYWPALAANRRCDRRRARRRAVVC